MAERTWDGGAQPVQQVTTVTVGGTLAGETFTISAQHPSGSTVDTVQIASHTDATTTIADTVAALVAAWNASNHRFASSVTAVDVSPSITFTSDSPGVPFILSLNTPGGSATFTQTLTTANSGPNDWNTPGNWREGVVPDDADNIIIQGPHSILYFQNTMLVEPNTMTVLNFSGRIGELGTPLRIDPTFFTWDANATGYIEFSDTNVVGTFVVDRTSSTGLFVTMRATGGGGLQSSFINGGNVTFAKSLYAPTVHLSGGSLQLIQDAEIDTALRVTGGSFSWTNQEAVSAIAAITVDDGIVFLGGTMAITLITVNGGEVTSSTSGTTTTATVNGGKLDYSKNRTARTVTTLNLSQAGEVIFDTAYLTVTTFNRTGPIRYLPVSIPTAPSRGSRGGR